MEKQTKKIYRSKTDKVIAGICGGLGEYFDIDPVLFRIIFVILALMSGVGILAYIILIFVIPEEGGGKVEVNKEQIKEFAKDVRQRTENLIDDLRETEKKSGKRNIIGAIIIIVGLLLLFNQILPFHILKWEILLSLAVIAIGFYIIFKQKNHGGK